MTTQKLSFTDLKISENNPYTKSGIKKMEIETNSISSRSSTPVPEISNKTSNDTEALVDKMIIESTIKNTTDIPNETTPKAISSNNNSMTESEDQDPNDPPFTTVVSKKQKLKNKKKGLGNSYHLYRGSEGSQKSGLRTKH
ncbi:4450_t:CDS:1 [Dentiscutata heterogama]|uniref:4450_t:CDS:1 n=1 Tax=Dentiscutata heterogama TaxID=1316150 RepID=A0ACA9MPX6_9GLOM|nr:4450_t:CDS:1 [Dentiscutata heterogama]